MFDKLKDMNRLRKMQADVKKQLEQIVISNEKSGTFVLVRGDKRIERIEIDGQEYKELRDLINDTMKMVDKKVEKQMRGQLSEMGFPGL